MVVIIPNALHPPARIILCRIMSYLFLEIYVICFHALLPQLFRLSKKWRIYCMHDGCSPSSAQFRVFRLDSNLNKQSKEETFRSTNSFLVRFNKICWFPSVGRRCTDEQNKKTRTTIMQTKRGHISQFITRRQSECGANALRYTRLASTSVNCNLLRILPSNQMIIHTVRFLRSMLRLVVVVSSQWGFSISLQANRRTVFLTQKKIATHKLPAEMGIRTTSEKK